MADEGEEIKPPHVLVFPYPGHGHMAPLLRLAESLASCRVCITVLTTTGNLNCLKPLLQKDLSIRPLVFPLGHMEGLPAGTEDIKDLSISLVPRFMVLLERLADPLEAWFYETAEHHEFGKPVCMISDIFLGWTQKTANRLGIPRVVFYPCGALTVSLINSAWEHLPHLNMEPEDGDDYVDVPGLPLPMCLKVSQLPPFARMCVPGDPLLESLRDMMLLNLRSWGAIVNTFDDLERECIEHLEKVQQSHVWPVGPLISTPKDISSVYESECFRFLSARNAKSVVYVCFGKSTLLPDIQITALAYGLEESGAPFLWVIPDEEEEDWLVLPEGFLDRVSERALVIRGWAEESAILCQPSIACFVSHCEWSGVLHSVTCGVPLVTWPFIADHHANDYLVVDHLKIGIRLCIGMDGVPENDTIVQAIENLTCEECEVRYRVSNLGEASKCAVENGGQSANSLLDFVKELTLLPCP